MQSHWFPAPDRLKDVLEGIWTIQAASDVRATVLPDATPYLVFQRDGTRLVSTDNDGESWSPVSLSGPRTSAFDIQLAASSQIFIVQLSSVGGFRTLGIPMNQVSDRCEDLTRVVDPSRLKLDELSERLMGDTNQESCVGLLQRWVRERAANSGSGAVGQVVREMRKHAGNCGVSSLAGKLDVSRRHLGRLVREEVGLSPKLFGRVVRFDQAVRLGRASPNLRLSQIASASGYADQSHMNREFMQLAGITPAEVQADNGATIW
ncbi:MAG: helix-turn-helix domain-containing protein [Planctomycetota bacterium]